jgi:hypothetical protein
MAAAVFYLHTTVHTTVMTVIYQGCNQQRGRPASLSDLRKRIDTDRSYIWRLDPPWHNGNTIGVRDQLVRPLQVGVASLRQTGEHCYEGHD